MSKQSRSPFFSVIIPLYNKEPYILNTLKSVDNQSFKDFEVIIVNDGSTDSSAKIADSFLSKKSKFHLFNTTNLGVSNARNYGIKLARGKFISFLDADDIWKNNHLSETKKSIEHFPNENIFCSNYYKKFKTKYIHPSFSIKIQKPITLIHNFFESSMKSSICIIPCLSIRKETALQNPFDAIIKSAEDTDLFIRLGIKHKFVFNKNITCEVNRYKSDGITQELLTESIEKMISKNINYENKVPYLKKYLDRNRFALYIDYIRKKEYTSASMTKNNIVISNLSLRNSVILLLPFSFVKHLLRFQNK